MPSQDALVVPTHEYLDRWSVGDLALAKTNSEGPETETKTTSPETKTQTKTDCSETKTETAIFRSRYRLETKTVVSTPHPCC